MTLGSTRATGGNYKGEFIFPMPGLAAAVLVHYLTVGVADCLDTGTI
jgi:hypothetical protein